MGFMERVDGTGSGLGNMESCGVPQRVCPHLYKMGVLQSLLLRTVQNLYWNCLF
jgi:hypothetical protein